MKSKWKLFISLALLISSSVYAGTKTENVICNDCSQSATSIDARSWGTRELGSRESGYYTAVNLKGRSYTTYSVTKKPAQPGPGTQRGGDEHSLTSTATSYTISVYKTSTPSYISSDINGLFNELSAYKNQIQSQSNEVPSSVISDPWDFLECSACDSRLGNYIRDDVPVIERIADNIIAYLSSLSIIDRVTDIHYIQLQSGGKVKVEVSMASDGSAFLTYDIKIVDVWDESGNRVPRDSNELREGIKYFIDEFEQAENINSTINRFGYGIPTSKEKTYVYTFKCTSNSHCTISGKEK